MHAESQKKTAQKMPQWCTGAGVVQDQLDTELMNAIMDAFAANTTMSTQALNSTQIQGGLKYILLGPAQLYEALRMRGGSRTSQPASNAL